MWWVSAGKNTEIGGAQSVEKSFEWRAPNRLLVVQTTASASQAKVFKAQAVPQGLCENLINPLKLLANQQKCKYNTSNDPFSRCKSVQQYGYR